MVAVALLPPRDEQARRPLDAVLLHTATHTGSDLNFTVPLNLSTFAFLGAAFWVHGTTLEVAPPLVRIAGMLFVALPRTTGANVLGCNPHSSVWPLFPPQNASAAACTIENGLWGAVFIILLIITAVLAY